MTPNSSPTLTAADYPLVASSAAPASRPAFKVIARPAFVSRKGNQYTSLLYRALRDEGVAVMEYTRRNLFTGDYHVFHVHWPDAVLLEKRTFRAFLALVGFVAQALFVVLLRRPIVWTVHNLRPHERHHPIMERLFYWWWHRMVGDRVFLSSTSRDRFRAEVGDQSLASGAVIHHGHYAPVLKNTWTRSAARVSFGLAAAGIVFGFFGLIRPYKNVPTLVRHFRQARVPDGSLLVAGMASDAALRAEIDTAAGGAANVKLVIKHLEADEVERAARAADIIVLPYTQVLNSGSALYALSCHRRVLAPAAPLFRELRDVVGGGWLRLYHGDLTAEVLEQAATDWAEPERPPDLRRLDWPHSARAHKLVYAQLMEREQMGRCV